jgi:hypothetical protein
VPKANLKLCWHNVLIQCEAKYGYLGIVCTIQTGLLLCREVTWPGAGSRKDFGFGAFGGSDRQLA